MIPAGELLLGSWWELTIAVWCCAAMETAGCCCIAAGVRYRPWRGQIVRPTVLFHGVH